jgi:CarboxypepD_reg-like domain/TonB-dependent Receptor Plug Domain
MIYKLISLLFTIITFQATAQTGVIKGIVTDKLTNEPIIGGIVNIGNSTLTAETDIDGNYIIANIEPGIYKVEVTYLGYVSQSLSEIEVQGVRPTILDFQMSESASQLQEIVVKTAAFRKTAESPLSLRSIGVAEIKRSPGGNRDISRVIQSLPGVTSTASFRNDLIIRGGAPNENKFFLDDVEVPVINHFATQGSSGGPAGIINVDFIREVDFFSGAFPANRGNTTSSVFNFKFKDGRDDRVGFTLTSGATDIGFTLDGPIGDKSTFLFSARRSYLQFLFKAIGLPFLPTYNDFNLKYKYKIDKKNEIYFIGIGAIDDFTLNLEADDTEAKQSLLDRLPVNTQWNYTNGLVYKHYGEKGFTTFVLSRNMLNNDAVKYFKNDDSKPENIILDYLSQEIENKLRIERTQKIGSWDLQAGAGYEYVKYNNNTVNKIFTVAGPEEINYKSDLAFSKYSLFGSVNRRFIKEKLNISLGMRLDGNNYSDDMSNPLEQFSPRFSLSYALGKNWFYNFNAGRYYQLPPYTSLGYLENGTFVNKQNNITYISATHFVTGIEYNVATSSRFTIEGYYKKYNNYPFLLREQISLANIGADFGIIGNQTVTSESEGRTYGIELLFQQRLWKGFYGIAAYTLGYSEFTNGSVKYTSSSWDSRHIVNLTMGKRFAKNWEIGTRFRFQTGLPFTTFDESSSLVNNWNRNNGGFPDYNRINANRRDDFQTLDLRVDKKWFFMGWDLNLYLDIQNITASAVPSDVLILDRPLDAELKPIGPPIITNPDVPLDQQRYKVKNIIDGDGTLLPTIGVVVSF